MTRYAVFDTETTGFGKNDRIIEIAIVLLDVDSRQPADEFDTLINPGRDVGRTDIHGITPSMLSDAPTFDEILPGIQERLDGAILVGHNLAFDVRMLQMEFGRLDVQFSPGQGLCTYRITGSKLELAAQELDVPLEDHHRALCDARVTADVFRRLPESEDSAFPASFGAPIPHGLVRTLRREATGWVPGSPLLRKFIRKANYPSSDAKFAAYFDMLDWSLADGVISDDERAELNQAKSELGLTDQDLKSIHESYLQSLLNAIHRDGRVTQEESDLFERVSSSLGISGRSIAPTPLPSVPACAAIRAGAHVCFTGNAVDSHGGLIDRESLERLAAAHGLQPVDRVTKKFCDLLVAQDPDTQSGKGKLAFKHGIPVISTADFLAHLKR
jgi:DNA polymerase III subunit epsilon